MLDRFQRGLPPESWWIGIERDKWNAVVAAQVDRMSESRFGQKGFKVTMGHEDPGLAQRSLEKQREMR